MSYFDTIQQYASNNNELQQHATEMGMQFASEKANTLKDKFDSINGDIEKWGGVLQGASSGWWMGRKIIRKIRSYTPDEQTVTQGGEKGEFNEEEMSKLGDTEKGALKFGDKPEDNPDNPFGDDKVKMDKPSDTDVDTSGETNVGRQGTDSSARSNVEPERVSNEPDLEPIAEDSIGESVANAQSSLERTQANLQKIQELGNTEDTIGESVARSQASLARTQANLQKINTPEGGETPAGTEGADTAVKDTTQKAVANETENATNDLGDAALKTSVEDGTKAVVTQVAEKTGVKSGLEIAGETLADSIPVVGEIVAVGTMIGGLFRDLFDKHHEEVKEQKAKLQGLSSGITQVGGVDTSAVASVGGAVSQVAGLV